jgi:formylglycine-generating enzyme required for sulfatase activity
MVSPPDTVPVSNPRISPGLIIGGLAALAIVIIISVLALNSPNQSAQSGTPTTQAAIVPTDTVDAPPTATVEGVTPTITLTPTFEPTIDIVGVVATLDEQGTASVRATNIAGTSTQAQVFVEDTATSIAGKTATATLWTSTPTTTLTLTPNVTASIEAFLTQRASDATTTAFVNQTATATLWTATPTPTPTPRPGIDAPVTANDQWQPIVQSFDSVEMVLVPVGCFMMGSEDGNSNEQPVHQQCFNQPFWIDRTEVSNIQFSTFNGIAAQSSHWGGDIRPRERITWFEARNFCEKRGARLPTEAEWEYAARGVNSLVYPWGNQFVAGNAIYGVNSGGRTAAVHIFPNGESWVKARNMSGNVWEWTNTIYNQIRFPYPYKLDDGRESNVDDSTMRVIRGGSWGSSGYILRAAFRSKFVPTIRYVNIGFRCARVYQEGDLIGAQPV